VKWRFCVLLLLAVSAFGSTVRLYLKDGTYQMVVEYRELPDRVTYLSAERSGVWEELPLDLVDLNRTRKEAAEHAAQLALEAKEDAEEENAIREEKRFASLVPADSGVYYFHDGMMEPLEQADVTVVVDGKRRILKDLSMVASVLFGHAYPPVPLTSEKHTLELQGGMSKFRIDNDQPEFYFRLATSMDGLALVTLTPEKNVRVVETVMIAPVTDDLEHKRKILPAFTKQHSEFVYKIWPEQPVPPGEYAAIEFEDAKGHLQVWDFGVGERK
jgi:hypothetical protein